MGNFWNRIGDLDNKLHNAEYWINNDNYKFYTGIFSSGVAYTLQIVGQKRINPTIASLIMSFESVFSALA